MSWKSDIAEWARLNDKEASRQEGILINEGWEPQKYKTSMKSQLFKYLDTWHKLHVKKMPTPATSLRRNPIKEFKKMSKLNNGWTVWTMPKNGSYTTIASDGHRYMEYSGNQLHDAANLHQNLIDGLSDSII